jgi:hypothetical protein
MQLIERLALFPAPPSPTTRISGSLSASQDQEQGDACIRNVPQREPSEENDLAVTTREEYEIQNALLLSYDQKFESKEEKEGKVHLLPLEEKIIQKGTFWCNECDYLNCEISTKPLFLGRGMSRLCCASCQTESAAGKWTCPDPQCGYKNNLAEADSRFLLLHFCLGCGSAWRSIEIEYQHYFLSEEVQCVWKVLIRNAKSRAERKRVREEFELTFG